MLQIGAAATNSKTLMFWGDIDRHLLDMSDRNLHIFATYINRGSCHET
jgi:hypothetical protein